MPFLRRDVLLGSTAILASASVNRATGQSLNKQQLREFSDQYGVQDYTQPRPDLRFLLESQQKRVAPSRNFKTFQKSLDESPLMQAMASGQSPAIYHLIKWHEFFLDLTSLDHTTVAGEADDVTFAEQLGPCRSSRALAILHLAVFEAVNAIYKRFESYKNIKEQIYLQSSVQESDVNPTTASVRLAIAYAARDTALAVYRKKAILVREHFKRLAPLVGDDDSERAKELGTRIGRAAAFFVLAARGWDEVRERFDDRSLDGYPTPEPNFDQLVPPLGPVDWGPDPVTKIQTALGGHWEIVEPFVITDVPSFRPPAPPPQDQANADFKEAYDDVRELGGDPDAPNAAPRWKTPTSRTADQSFIGIYWAYDGTALLCAPPRLYNMVATSIALNERPIDKVEEMARYLALVNLALADAGIAAWDAKYHFRYPRPVGHIRRSNPGLSVGGVTNRDWTPLGAPVSNGRADRANLTPPFPAYPSGHATFGAALFTTISRYFGISNKSDASTSFTFVSDEYNGLNRGSSGEARPLRPVTFTSFKQAEDENARSRIYLGIHWKFDASEGIKQGEKVANAVFDGVLGPA